MTHIVAGCPNYTMDDGLNELNSDDWKHLWYSSELIRSAPRLLLHCPSVHCHDELVTLRSDFILVLQLLSPKTRAQWTRNRGAGCPGTGWNRSRRVWVAHGKCVPPAAPERQHRTVDYREKNDHAPPWTVSLIQTRAFFTFRRFSTPPAIFEGFPRVFCQISQHVACNVSRSCSRHH